MKRLCKLKYNAKEDEMLVKYEVHERDHVDTFTLESTEGPRSELVTALKTMAGHLCGICEFPGDWASKITVRSVTVTWSNEIRGLVITGLRALDGSNSPLVVNSPHFTEVPYNDDSESQKNIYSLECGIALDILTELAFKFVDGERRQLQFEFVQPGEPTAAGGVDQ